MSQHITDYDPHTRDVLTTGNSYASVKNQLSIGANAFVAVFAMFGVGYYLGRQYTDDRTQQLIFGLIGNTLSVATSDSKIFLPLTHSFTLDAIGILTLVPLCFF